MCQKHTPKTGKRDSQNLLELPHPLKVISQEPMECNDTRAETNLRTSEWTNERMHEINSSESSACSKCDAYNLENIYDW